MAHGNNPSYRNEEIHKYYFEEIARISIFCQSDEITGKQQKNEIVRIGSSMNLNERFTCLANKNVMLHYLQFFLNS